MRNPCVSWRFFDPFQVVNIYIYIYTYFYIYIYTFGIYDFMYRIYTGFQLWNNFVLVGPIKKPQHMCP